jgi:hypothetical protein
MQAANPFADLPDVLALEDIALAEELETEPQASEPAVAAEALLLVDSEL